MAQYGQDPAADLVNRFSFHPARDADTMTAHETIRDAALTFAQTISTVVPDGREKALAITKAEEAMMWANAGIARSNPIHVKE